MTPTRAAPQALLMTAKKLSIQTAARSIKESGRSLLKTSARKEQIKQCLRRRRQVPGTRAQQFFLRHKHLRVDCFVHALDDTGRNHLSVESGRDADQLPFHTLEGSLH